MVFGRRALISTGLGLLLGASVATGGSGVLAQGATPEATPIDGEAVTGAPRPAHIHAGSCPEVGDVVAPLNDLVEGGGAPGADALATGIATGAIPAEYSFTTVPLTIDDILAGEHAINVHESADNIETYIACGNIGGTVDANGSLVIGLREVESSGFAGIAVLSPSVAAGSTDVSVFIASDLTDDTEEGV